MIPLKVERPVRTLPWVNIGLIALNAAVFLFFNVAHPGRAADLAPRLGFVPRQLFQITADAPVEALDAVIRLFTAMFLHGGWLHLLGNVLYLSIFGDNVEEKLGHRRYLAFYLLCGVAAALTHGAVFPDSQTPVVGASGAVAGVLGAYFLFFPATRVKTLWFFGFFFHITVLPAALLLGLWAVLQIVSARLSGATATIAWFAHIGGFGAGLVAAPLLARLNRRRQRT
jgi:membrane associated rhomboid family serine protease